jgi:hypothetical protein
MPKVSDTPNGLKVYVWHGVQLVIAGEEALGDCPWCGREKKFSVNVQSGQWRCFVCNEGEENGKAHRGGNPLTFLRMLHKMADETTNDYTELLQHRKLLDKQTLIRWGVARNPLTGEWLIPGYGPNGQLCQLYRYARFREEGRDRWSLLATPTLNHGLFGCFSPTDLRKPEVYITEGPWDGMALWEMLGKAKRVDGSGKLGITGAEPASLLANTNVLAVPGCGTFYEPWAGVTADKIVTMCYDNDHPRRHPRTGQLMPPAGHEGMRRAISVLAGAEEPPQTIKYLYWGPQGYDLKRKDGMDVRDVLTNNGEDEIKRLANLEGLLKRIRPIQAEWVAGRTRASAKSGGMDLELLPCSDWNTAVAACKEALEWTEGLDRALSIMYAVIVSTKAVGDQLWAKIIGPPACGKSTLCEALSVNKKYVKAKSTIRGFHSGFKSDKEGKEDNSLISSLKDMTLITKDGDALLQSPNLGQILSEARDLYDRVSRTHYRNRMGRDYSGINMTWLLCGTSSLRSIDSSELGERFLDCVIIDEIDEDLEDKVGWSVALQAERDCNFEADGTPETRESPDKTHMRQVCGGYVSYLRENAQRLLNGVKMSHEAMKRCQHLAKFVAIMRARPSVRQEEKAERELSFRLISQMVRLAKCLSVVLNRKTPDEEVMRRVTRTAMDTARGRTFELCRWLYKTGAEGAETKSLAFWTGESEEKERVLLKFLRKIGAVDFFHAENKPYLRSKPRWRLTERMLQLYEEVMNYDVAPTVGG